VKGGNNVSNLKKNLTKVLIGLNAIVVASFFLNWVKIVNVPGFVSGSNKKILDSVQILGNLSPMKLIGRMSQMRRFYTDYNDLLIANDRMPQGIPAETNVSIWLIVMLVLAILTILALVLIPNKKYTLVLPLVTALYTGGVVTSFVVFMLKNNRLQAEETVATPSAFFVLLVIAVVLNILIAGYLFFYNEVYALKETEVRNALIGLNVLYVASLFANWLHLQMAPLFIAREGGGIDNAMSILGDYSLVSLFTTLGKAKEYYATNGLEPISQISNQVGIVIFAVTAIASIIVLLVAKKRVSIAFSLISSVMGVIMSLGFILFAHKYNVVREDIQIATVSPIVLMVLVISLIAVVSTAVTLAERNRENYGYVFVAPFFIIFFTFLIYPNLQTLYFTFTNKSTAVAPFEVIGLDNWARFIQDSQFRTAFVNTWQIWGLNIIIQLGLALLLVFIFYDITWKMKGLGFFRTVFYLPNLITLASVAMLFRILLDWKYGAVNQSLVSMGLLSSEIAWLQQPNWAQFWVAIIGGWMWFGNSFLFLMAGVQGISKDYFEAAKVDGANRIQMFSRITLPLLRPIMLYVTITSLIGGMQIFELPQLLTDGIGAPGNSLLTMVLMLYNQYFKYKNMAYASTVAYGLFFVTMFFTITYYLIVYGKRDKGGVN